MDPNSNYLDLPSPFNLPRPSAHWLRVLHHFDPDLVIFPSQKQPGVYRLMRRARNSGGLTSRLFRKLTSLVHPDTKIAFEQRLVSVTTVPLEAVRAPAEKLCAQLRLRDTWRFGGPSSDASALALERMEAEEAAKQNAAWRAETRVRHRAARNSFLYRSGARVSLVNAWRDGPAAQSPSTPAASAAPVSTLE